MARIRIYVDIYIHTYICKMYVVLICRLGVSCRVMYIHTYIYIPPGAQGEGRGVVVG